MEKLAYETQVVTPESKDVLSILFPDRPKSALTSQDVSLACDGLNYLLVAFECPPELRALIDVVIGASEGRFDYFECPDIDLAKRMWPKSESTDDALRKKVSRWRKELVEWQKANITLVEYIEGDRLSPTRLRPTQWKVTVFPLLMMIIEDAQDESDYAKEPARAIRRVAESVAKTERLRLLTPPKRQRKRRPIPGNDRKLHASVTYADSYIRNAADSDQAVAIFIEALAERSEAFSRHLRKLESLQVVEPVEASVVDIFVHHGTVFDPPNGTILTPPEGPDLGGYMPPVTPPDPPDFVQCINRTVDKVEREDESQGGGSPNPEVEARRALEPFQSFPDAVLSLVTLLTLTDDSPPRKKVVGNHRNPSQAELKSDLGKWLEDAERLDASVFFRWTGSFIQVDDCNEFFRELLDPFSFFQVETSPGSFQSWLHLDFPPGYSLTEQAIHLESVRDRLLGRLAEISKARWPSQKEPNGGSYGSVRWPGSRNFKPDRIRENSGTAPQVRMVAGRPLFGVRADELDAADLLTPVPTPCATPPLPNPPSCDSTVDGEATPGWKPDYQTEVDRCNGDRNRGDFRYAHLSIEAGWPGHVVIRDLQELSEKSKERKDEYAVMTVLKVIAYQELKAGHSREVVEAHLVDVSRKAGSSNPALVTKALTKELIKLGML